MSDADVDVESDADADTESDAVADADVESAADAGSDAEMEADFSVVAIVFFCFHFLSKDSQQFVFIRVHLL